MRHFKLSGIQCLAEFRESRESVSDLIFSVIPSLLLGVCHRLERALPSSAFLLHDSISLFLSAHWLVRLLFPSALAPCICVCVFWITSGVWLICQQSWSTVSTASLGWLQLARYPSSIILWILCNLLLASSSYANESFIFFHILVFPLQQIRLISYQLCSLSTSSTAPLHGQNHTFAAL